MPNSILKYLFAAVVLLFSQSLCAQFYKRDDSSVRVLKGGVQKVRSVNGDDKKSTVKSASGTKKAKAAKKTKKRTTKKSSAKSSRTVKKSVRKDSVVYRVKYSLGDRIIMRGDSGADVKKVAEILVKHLFLDEKDVPYTATGQVLYDGELVRALKIFQRVEGMYDDGIVGTATIKALRKRNARKR